MPSWKKRTRALRRQAYYDWRERDSDSNHKSRWGKRRYYPIYSWEGWGHRSWRKREKLREKQDNEHVKSGMARFAAYPYYEDCRYHVCKQTEIVPNDPARGRIDVNGESIFNGTPSSCSYEHCGIRHLTKEQGEERAAFAIKMGMLPYQLTYVYVTKDVDREHLINNIRSSLAMERTWKFSENSKMPYITDLGKEWLAQTHQIKYDELTPFSDEEMEAAYARDR